MTIPRTLTRDARGNLSWDPITPPAAIVHASADMSDVEVAEILEVVNVVLEAERAAEQVWAAQAPRTEVITLPMPPAQPQAKKISMTINRDGDGRPVSFDLESQAKKISITINRDGDGRPVSFDLERDVAPATTGD